MRGFQGAGIGAETILITGVSDSLIRYSIRDSAVNPDAYSMDALLISESVDSLNWASACRNEIEFSFRVHSLWLNPDTSRDTVVNWGGRQDSGLIWFRPTNGDRSVLGQHEGIMKNHFAEAYSGDTTICPRLSNTEGCYVDLDLNSIMEAGASVLPRPTSQFPGASFHLIGRKLEISVPAAAQIQVVDIAGQQVAREAAIPVGTSVMNLPQSASMLFVQARSGSFSTTLRVPPIR